MAKIPGKGSVLQLNDGGTGLVAIANVISIDGPGREAGTWNSTDLGSGADMTFEPTGYTDNGEVSAEIFYDPTLPGHIELEALMDAPEKVEWAIVYSDGAEREFDGILTKFEPTIVMEDGVKANITVKVSGGISRS